MQFFYFIVLMLTFYLLIVAEFFLPTGGLLAAAAIAILVSAIVIAFSHSLTAGIVLLVVVCVTTPMLLIGMIRIWPHTPIGRRILNRRPGELAKKAKPKTTREGKPIDELVGRFGAAKTDLLPSGLVVVDGEKMDAISIGMPIEAGMQIMVTSTEGGRVHVRTASEEELKTQQKDEPATPQSPPSLEQSLDSFDLD